MKNVHLKFLDALQFLAPGYNLKSFFKAFGVSEQKVSFLMIILLLLINSTRQFYRHMKLFTHSINVDISITVKMFIEFHFNSVH